ncbi:MAG: hypothetical protein C0418_03665 [Coriobacteriaceae bacterium]|nr:hypothetical protein [Coriobacteriaceae bacterium]
MRSHQAEAPVRECGAKDQVSRVRALTEGAGLRRVARIILAVVALAAACGAAACARPAEPAPVPKIKPPAIKTAGVLTAGVDLGYPPFAGEDHGVRAGLDIDVAAALAERLGLKLALVGASPKDAARKLDSGVVDVVIAALPIDQSLITDVTFAGSYAVDAPVFFVAVESSRSPAPEPLTLDTLGDRRLAVQEGSASGWRMVAEFGDEGVQHFATLRLAFEALTAGQVDAVAADGIVGAYIARDLPTVRYAGQAGPAVPLGVAVRKDATELETAVREALDGLAADGVLDAVRSKWATPLPEPVIERAEETTTP